MHRLFAFSLLFGAVAEAKFKLTTPSSAGIVPFRFVLNCYFTPKIPARRPRYLALLSRRIVLYGSNLCFVQSDYALCLGKCLFAASQVKF